MRGGVVPASRRYAGIAGAPPVWPSEDHLARGRSSQREGIPIVRSTSPIGGIVRTYAMGKGFNRTNRTYQYVRRLLSAPSFWLALNRFHPG